MKSHTEDFLPVVLKCSVRQAASIGRLHVAYTDFRNPEHFMGQTHPPDSRLDQEARFQDERMRQALQGEAEFRDKFYFINRLANRTYDDMHLHLAGKRVIVVGCSDTGVTPLARKGVHVEGIDISQVSIDKLNRAIDEEGLRGFANARLMDAENLEYPAGSIDAITCSGVLHHLKTEDAMRSWSRSVKQDGEVLMFEPLALHPFAALFRVLTPSMRTSDEHPLRERDFDLMRKYFSMVERKDFGLLTPIAAAIAVVPGLSGLARAILPALEKGDALLLRALPVLRRFCWLTVVRLRQPRATTAAQAPRSS
jgi:SAM-dependent methyltransferase